MNENFVINSIRSVVSEPDYVGANGTQRNPIKMFLGIFIVSLAICGITMNLLSGPITLLGHVFWILFHSFYIGGLFYYFGKKWKMYHSIKLEV
jgi:hypothetical protein